METTSHHQLQYTTATINSNFRIKVSGTTDNGKIHCLMGVSGIIDLVGDIRLINSMLERAFSSMQDKCECKLRRGIRIIFYVK